ncbi:xanthine dehydrogenase small subunit [soil metagenome]
MPLLEFIRYHQHLTGTKTGCNEGDCGACTILIGELVDSEVEYRSYTSCLTALANAHGKHVVTIEGLNLDKVTGQQGAETLNPIQLALYEESATQCGFCTPGFVVSLAGFCLSGKTASTQNAIAAIDGNICRCTGYKSLEKAAARVAALMEDKDDEQPLTFLTKQKILPDYFNGVKEKLSALNVNLNGEQKGNAPLWLVGGGTDLYVQKHEELKDTDVYFVKRNSVKHAVIKEGNRCLISSHATVTDLLESDIMNQYFTNLQKHVKLVSSTPIRNMATIAGNFVNASPIGDFTIFFLALNAQLVVSNGNNSREISLRNFYKAYKKLDKLADEHIENIWFELPAPNSFFNFEKVSKRTNLDIASVNSAMHIVLKDDTLIAASLSAGGVGPIPKYLEKTSIFLTGKEITAENITAAQEIAQTEISPISDARGAETYKRLLLNQLIKAHFIQLEVSLKQA